VIRYIDLDSGQVRKFMTASPVVAETSKRGARLNHSYRFVRDAVVIDLDPDGEEVVILGFKTDYDSVAYVLGPFEATKTGGGATEDPATYTFTDQLLNAQLDRLLAGNLDEVTLRPEIKWTSANENGETLAFHWNIQNNVNRGGESVIAYPTTDTVLDLPLVTRLTGGVYPTDLDAQLLAGFANGKKFTVTTDLDGSGTLGQSTWQKRTGTELVTDVVDGPILCLDGTRIYRVAG
jgi:hypothetical protein